MTELNIRPCEESDEPRIRAISNRLQEGFAPWRSQSKIAATIEGWIDAALASRSDDDHLVLVADDADAGVIGFIAVTVQQHYISGRDAYIGELAVDASHGGKGIGAALVAEATTWAGDQGCERLTLQTGAANHGARQFYERLGFDYEDVSLARGISQPGESRSTSE